MGGEEGLERDRSGKRERRRKDARGGGGGSSVERGGPSPRGAPVRRRAEFWLQAVRPGEHPPRVGRMAPLPRRAVDAEVGPSLASRPSDVADLSLLFPVRNLYLSRLKEFP